MLMETPSEKKGNGGTHTTEKLWLDSGPPHRQGWRPSELSAPSARLFTVHLQPVVLPRGRRVAATAPVSAHPLLLVLLLKGLFTY